VREWGLHISTSRGKTSIGVEEPALFAEPAIFLLRSDRTLYRATMQSMPFARPHFDEILSAVDLAINNGYLRAGKRETLKRVTGPATGRRAIRAARAAPSLELPLCAAPPASALRTRTLRCWSTTP
jgi:hypothetical protein